VGFEFSGSVGEAIVWDVATGEKRASLLHQGSVGVASFSPDSQQIVTASADRTARVWDAATGRPVTPPMRLGGRSWSGAASFSRDGSYVVTACYPSEFSWNSSIRVWDATTGHPMSPQDDLSYSVGWIQGKSIVRSRNLFDDARIWSLSAEDRTAAFWVSMAEVISGRRLDSTGDLVPIDAKRRVETWKCLQSEAGEELASSTESSIAWHRREVIRLTEASQWDAAAWHCQRLATTDPAGARVYQLAEAVARQENAAQENLNEGNLLLSPRAASESWPAVRRAALVAQGRWDEAAEPFAEWVSHGSFDLVQWSQNAVVQLMAGRSSAYSEACERMVRQLAPVGDVFDPNTIAWICAYGPNALPDSSRIVAIAEQAIAENGREPNTLNTLGAACYRAGRFNDALRALEAGVREHDEGGSVEDWLFLAMTEFRLRRAARAYKFLQEATRSIAGHATPRSKVKTETWDQNLVRRILLREAETLILDTTFPRDPFAH
jgi:tetratricopeptide (TPR) repeat protein